MTDRQREKQGERERAIFRESHSAEEPNGRERERKGRKGKKKGRRRRKRKERRT